jgi:hypothetical protein
MRAGAPFGGDDPGCVPDGKPVAHCSDGAGKALAKLIGAVMGCHMKQATSAAKQVTFDEEACEQTDSVNSAHAKFEASLAKLTLVCGGTSVLSATDAIGTALLADSPAVGSLDTLTGGIYCDPTSGTPLGGDDQGFVPADKGGLACANSVAKGLGKVAAAVLTCHRKAAANGLKGASTDDELCETGARAKFDALTAKLSSKGGCPGCLGSVGQGALADSVVAIAEQTSGSLYPCPAPTTTLQTTSTTTSTSTSTTHATTTLQTTTTTSTTTTTTLQTTTTTTASTTTTTTIAGCTAATTHRPFSVSFAVPDSSVIVQGLTLLIDYPEMQVTIPGSGNATTVRQAIINVQTGALSSPFDLDNALREQIAGTANPLTPGQLFTINFFDCVGATPPTAADFSCTVQVATDPLGLPDTGVTCAVN